GPCWCCLRGSLGCCGSTSAEGPCTGVTLTSWPTDTNLVALVIVANEDPAIVYPTSPVAYSNSLLSIDSDWCSSDPGTGVPVSVVTLLDHDPVALLNMGSSDHAARANPVLHVLWDVRCSPDYLGRCSRLVGFQGRSLYVLCHLPRG